MVEINKVVSEVEEKNKETSSSTVVTYSLEGELDVDKVC